MHKVEANYSIERYLYAIGRKSCICKLQIQGINIGICNYAKSHSHPDLLPRKEPIIRLHEGFQEIHIYQNETRT